jgi:hypothetical protein
MFVAWLIFPFLMILYILNCQNELRINKNILILGLGYKICLSSVCCYFIINNWNFGDLHDYLVKAKFIESNCFTLLKNNNCNDIGIIGGNIVAWINGLLLIVMPYSIYGYSILSGTVAFIYSYLLLLSFNKYFKISITQYLFIIFLPINSIFSSFIGKETIILPLLGLFFYYLFSDIKRRIIYCLILVVLMSLIRPYTLLIFSITTYIFIIYYSNIKNLFYILPATLVLIILFIGIFNKYIWWTNLNEIHSISDMVNIFRVAFEGGNLMLEPYIFPISILQNFRPFFWEANNWYNLVGSFENTLILLYIFSNFFKQLGLKYKNKREANKYSRESKLKSFCFFYVLVNMFFFSFSSNINDLFRRHVYYMPILILLYSKQRISHSAPPPFVKRNYESK